MLEKYFLTSTMIHDATKMQDILWPILLSFSRMFYSFFCPNANIKKLLSLCFCFFNFFKTLWTQSVLVFSSPFQRPPCWRVKVLAYKYFFRNVMIHDATKNAKFPLTNADQYCKEFKIFFHWKYPKKLSNLWEMGRSVFLVFFFTSQHTLNTVCSCSSARPADEVSRVFGCATMWHESPEEMVEMLRSIFRMDEDWSARWTSTIFVCGEAQTMEQSILLLFLFFFFLGGLLWFSIFFWRYWNLY